MLLHIFKMILDIEICFVFLVNALLLYHILFLRYMIICVIIQNSAFDNINISYTHVLYRR